MMAGGKGGRGEDLDGNSLLSGTAASHFLLFWNSAPCRCRPGFWMKPLHCLSIPADYVAAQEPVGCCPSNSIPPPHCPIAWKGLFSLAQVKDDSKKQGGGLKPQFKVIQKLYTACGLLRLLQTTMACRHKLEKGKETCL
ncbi:hypothetical protein M5K25_010130 [Dendrobium thyrsiflorum]|uniref:Uncharacterized protein n=1 Tax=Dendrobium thyrsiflorum TaxID=117978 RepID=A0ABD0UYW2_DENTH